MASGNGLGSQSLQGRRPFPWNKSAFRMCRRFLSKLNARNDGFLLSAANGSRMGICGESRHSGPVCGRESGELAGPAFASGRLGMV